MGLTWFGISIALLKKSKPVMAGIYLPYYDLLYFAEKGKGAFRNDQHISVSKYKKLEDVLLSYSLDYSEDFSKTKKEAKIIELFVHNVRNLRATNSPLDFCYTADGRFGGCINQTTKIWDVAAPYLIIKEAGGVVSDIYGKDLDFAVSESNYQHNFTIVASNKVLHPKIINIIKKIMF